MIFVVGILAVLWLGWLISRPRPFVFYYYVLPEDDDPFETERLEIAALDTTGECVVCDGLGCEYCPKAPRSIG